MVGWGGFLEIAFAVTTRQITSQHELGRPKSLGFGNRNLPEDHAFGMSSRINTGTDEKEWGALSRRYG